MTQLELKHIQHYPIGTLEVICPNNERAKLVSIITRDKLVSVITTDPSIKSNRYFGNEKLVHTEHETNDDKSIYSCNSWRSQELSQIKPILRPMSDLYKEIDGKIGIVELAKILIDNPENQYEFLWNREKNRVDIFLHKHNNKYLSYCYESPFNLYDFGSEKYEHFNQSVVFEYLFEHHFDVDDLIKKELAIDVNTI